MTTAWDWRFILGRNSIDLTIDLRSFMVGTAIGPRDLVLHVGPLTLTIEHHEALK